MHIDPFLGHDKLERITVTLDGNRPVRVDDASSATAASGVTAFTDRVSQTTEYTYDANGNLTSDLNRGISSITYNLLNLPARISWSDGSTVSYRYDADGTLLREDRTIYIQTQFGRKVFFPQSRRIYQIRLHQRPLLISTR